MPRDDELFVDALETPEAERSAFLSRACADDPGQQARIEALLRAHGRAPACFDRRVGRTEWTNLLEEKAGTFIGRYRLVERLGEGGCGVVWIADQSEPVRRRVALKVIKLGMDTKEVITRFEAERQALAMMDHPNIARVFDAGATDTGRPFFVMELVRGATITRYCDEARLPMRERLRLFIAVCHAVQHAHQKGIIHRDLKPSNILIEQHDGVAVPKVIDFGIAKAMDDRLTDAPIVTAMGQFIGTPAYMSPEQIGGFDIDTRSDLYALGVLLYELLAGRPPFEARTLQKAGFDEMRRIIREVEPAKPSTHLQTLTPTDRAAVANLRAAAPTQLTTQLTGDLDWIVMKALEKERSRRYETASALALDLQRHLAHEPVFARPPTRAYVLKKLVRRHRAAFAAVTGIAGVLVLGAAVSAWQALRATRAEGEQKRLRLVEGELRRSAEAQALNMRRRAYASDLNLAQRSIADGNLGRGRELLLRQRPAAGELDLRGWEWRYLWQRTEGEQRFLFRPGPGAATCVVFSPDGAMFATAGGNQPVQVWATATRARVASLSIPGRGVQPNNLAFSPDGRSLAACCRGTVIVWDTGAWRELVRLPGVERNEYSQPVVFSPDSRALALLSGDEIQFWDTQRWQRQTTVRPESVRHGLFALSDDWRLLAVGGIQRTEIWDRAAARMLAEIPGWTVALQFSPRGQLLAVGNYEGNVLFWDTGSNREVGRWKAHRSAVRSVSFSADGKVLATGGEDHALHFWDVATRQRIASRLGHEQPIAGISFSSDGRTLVSASADGTVRFWSADETTALSELAGSAAPLGFSADGATFATLGIDPSVQYWDAATRKLIRAAPLPVTETGPASVCLAADGKTVAIPRITGPIEIWNTELQSSLGVLSEPDATIEALAFSPDLRWLASVHRHRGGAPQTATIIWDLATHRIAARLAGGGTALTFSPDGTRLALRRGKAIQLLDTSTMRSMETPPQVVKSLSPAGEGSIYALAFSPDSKQLAAGGRAFAARIWDVATGRHLADTTGHVGGVFAVAFAPDGRTLVTGSVDGALKFWDTTTWQELMTVSDYAKSATRLMFSPDGMMLAVGSTTAGDQRAPVQLWSALGWRESDSPEKIGQP